jgi:transcriptional regulator with XRE-family HTH domain
MPLRTTAIEAAAARGWSKAELQRRTGLSLSTIYNLESGIYAPSGRTIAAIMRVFPDLPYERLFLPVDSTKLQPSSSQLEAAA